MRVLALGVSLLALGIVASAVAVAQTSKDTAPYWAWGWDGPPPSPPNPPGAPRDSTTKHSVPGSTLAVTEVQANDRYNPPDWFPDDHKAMPNIVAHGRESAMIFACGLCHLPNGLGRPENANVTGLSPEYFKQQILDFKNGLRVTSDSRKTNTATMAAFAKDMTEQEIDDAAAYFANIQMRPDWIKVVEASTVPKTRGNGNWPVVIEGAGAGTEPIGNRIIETPVSPDDQEKWRNFHSGFVAYVPPGSIKKGEALAMNGDGGRVVACTTCHGEDLRGLGPIPRLAGRSPSYLARQLYDMQHGNRAGAWSPLMAQVVAKLDANDLVNVSAYLASLPP